MRDAEGGVVAFIADTGAGMTAEVRARASTLLHHQRFPGYRPRPECLLCDHGPPSWPARDRQQGGSGHDDFAALPGLADSDRSAPARGGRRDGEPEKTNHATVLVVDDDAHIRDLLEEMLTLEGHAVTISGSASNALEAAKARSSTLPWSTSTSTTRPASRSPRRSKPCAAPTPSA